VIVSTELCVSRQQAADHLRFVPWEKRHTRYLPPGDHSFSKDEIKVRSGPDKYRPPLKDRYDEFVYQLCFGYDDNRKNGFTAGL
jgi:hypothetical protein